MEVSLIRTAAASLRLAQPNSATKAIPTTTQQKPAEPSTIAPSSPAALPPLPRRPYGNNYSSNTTSVNTKIPASPAADAQPNKRIVSILKKAFICFSAKQ